MILNPYVVGIGGTTRSGSSSERLVKRVLFDLEKQGAKTLMFGGDELAELPHYAPENHERSIEQQAFVEAARKADAFVIGSPSYHGGVSGLVKNALDLLEELVATQRFCWGCNPGHILAIEGREVLPRWDFVLKSMLPEHSLP